MPNSDESEMRTTDPHDRPFTLRDALSMVEVARELCKERENYREFQPFAWLFRCICDAILDGYGAPHA